MNMMAFDLILSINKDMNAGNFKICLASLENVWIENFQHVDKKVKPGFKIIA